MGFGVTTVIAVLSFGITSAACTSPPLNTAATITSPQLSTPNAQVPVNAPFQETLTSPNAFIEPSVEIAHRQQETEAKTVTQAPGLKCYLRIPFHTGVPHI